jgi:hypothetical protein
MDVSFSIIPHPSKLTYEVIFNFQKMISCFYIVVVEELNVSFELIIWGGHWVG